MRSLILVAHGSRRAESNAEVQTLTHELRDRIGERFDHVDCAFLEFAKPSIPAAIDAAIGAGSADIVVLPYFLAGGTHITEHIPALIAAKRAEHPTVNIELKPHVGSAQAMLDVLTKVL